MASATLCPSSIAARFFSVATIALMLTQRKGFHACTSETKKVNVTAVRILTMTFKRTLSLGSILVLGIIAANCNWGQQSHGNERRYPIKGTVVSVNKQDHTAAIKHEDIPGYMQSMTMDFKIKNE